MGIYKKLAYPYEYFNRNNDYEKPGYDLKKEDFFSKLKNDYPNDNEIKRMTEIINSFNIKNCEELTKLYSKSDIPLLVDIFEKFIKVSIEDFDINPLYCVSLPGYTCQCWLNYTVIRLQVLQDEDIILLLENNVRGGISSVTGDGYVKSDDNEKIVYIYSNSLYGHSMSQPLPYDEIKFDKNVELEDIMNTPDDSDIGYFVEIECSYPEKTKNFPFALEIRKINPNSFTTFMNENKSNNYTESKKILCDWTDKKKYLIHYRMLKFYVRHGMIVD